MKKEVEKLTIQVEGAVIEEEAAQLAVAEQERAITSFQNDLKKLKNFVQEKYTYLSKLEDSIAKWSSKPNRLSERIESVKADILRMRHTVDNQSINLEETKQAEQEYRELEESTEMGSACCNACLKLVYADDLQIAELRSDSKAISVAYSATLIEYSYKVPELNLLNVSVNPLHRDADQTMQDILNQLDNIRTQLKTQLNEMENELEETEKRERRTLELKFAANEECSSAARRVEEIDIAKLKEETKQEKQRLKQELKRVEDECARCAKNSSTLEVEKRKLVEALEVSHTIKDDILDTAEQVRAHFAGLAATYNDLMKKMMAVNEAQEESLKHFI
jgi:chromosome segregation ATPase